MIHRQAYVAAGCHIGRDVKVWQFASAVRNARIGDGTIVGPTALVDGAVLGSGCKVGAGAKIHPGVVVGDKVFIGPGACFCNDHWPRVDDVGFDIERFWDGFVTIRVEDGASIGANALILPGVVIGAKAMVAGGSRVTADVPAHSLWMPNGTIKPDVSALAHQRMREAGSLGSSAA